jgi:hypothetical protein
MVESVSEKMLRPRKTRAIAWVALGVGALVSAWVFWSASSASSSFYLAAFGPANDGAFGYLFAIYVALAIFEVVTFFLVKGWRNRVIVIAGVVALLIPIPVGIWIAESSFT